MFLIGAIKPIVKIISKLYSFSTRLFWGGELREYKIKPVLFLFVLCFLAAIKTLQKLT